MAASSVRVLHTAGDETDYSGTALLSLALLSPWRADRKSSLIAKFHYTGPTEPDRTGLDQTKSADFVGDRLNSTTRARVVEFSLNTASYSQSQCLLTNCNWLAIQSVVATRTSRTDQQEMNCTFGQRGVFASVLLDQRDRHEHRSAIIASKGALLIPHRHSSTQWITPVAFFTVRGDRSQLLYDKRRRSR